MNNPTLLLVLCMVLGINMVFAFSVTKNRRGPRYSEWRLSSVALFAGVILLLLQGKLSPFFTMCIANYLIVAGFYMQVSAALSFHHPNNRLKKLFFPIISALFWILFLYFTYISFDTSVRIIVFASLLVSIYSCGVIQIAMELRDKGFKQTRTKELFVLFILSVLFYLFRATATIMSYGEIDSIFDNSLITSLSFLYPIFFNVSYVIAMFLTTINEQTALLVKEQEKQSALFHFLNDTARHLDRKELFNSIEKILKDSLGMDTAAIYFKDRDKDTYSIAHSFNHLGIPGDSIRTLRAGEGVTGKAISKNRVVSMRINDYPDSDLALNFSSKGCTEIISAPLRTPDGIIGAVTAAYSENTRKEILDQEFFYYLAEQIALVLHNAYLFEKVSNMASTDPLTGLLNRRKLLQLLQQESDRSKRYNLNLTLAMMDLDHFKKINDKFGHDSGDTVLETVSALIRKGCRQTDLISRWGGEEFLLIFVETDIEAASAVCERIRTMVESADVPCLMGDRLTVSAGVAPFDFEQSIEQNIDLADKALYMAKNGGRNRVTAIKLPPEEGTEEHS
ncbi:MAG: sensor domain-containing diguanylate cyclase [Spirochaetales bacterium]|nr:sensor domain-containing diguanylate cyclase [Spirochaetales bacterium]